ncbi:MAG: helix-turn-helix domain-containing protein [Oceanidesulfovibrio sp.]
MHFYGLIYRVWREHLGLTQAELAERMGVSRRVCKDKGP